MKLCMQSGVYEHLESWWQRTWVFVEIVAGERVQRERQRGVTQAFVGDWHSPAPLSNFNQ